MKIETCVNMNIFESPKVKEKANRVFEETKEDFNRRFEEIKDFIMSRGYQHIDCNTISAEDVQERFTSIFFEKVGNLAVKSAFETKNHDLEENLIESISKENIEAAIEGHTMIEAFCKVIQTLPGDGALTATLNGSLTILLRKKFIENSIGTVHATVVREIYDADIR